MPHIVIEHSTDGHGGRLDPVGLMQALHDAAAATGVMQAADIKVRAIAYADYLVARRRDGFCHVTVSMLEGRAPAQKEALGVALRAAMVEHLPATTSLSVDVRDMDAVSYKKRLHEQT